MSKHDLGTVTPQTDSRQRFEGEWPVRCEAPDCPEDMSYRVRSPETGAPWYLCTGHAFADPYAHLPAQHRDLLAPAKEVKS